MLSFRLFIIGIISISIINTNAFISVKLTFPREITISTSTSAFIRHKLPGFSSSLRSGPHDDILKEHLDELKSLRETPELVDKLERLARLYPGIEMNLDLYRAIYPFKLDKFQEDGLSSLMSGSSVLVSTPTGKRTINNAVSSPFLFL